MDGYTKIPGGWLNHHWIQLGYHLAASAAGMTWSFVITSVILNVMNLIPWLRLRAAEDEEVVGMDESEIGEFAVSPFPFKTAGHDRLGCSNVTELMMWSSTTMSK